MTAAEALRHVADLVEGDRNSTHGTKQKNFGSMAGYLHIYLKERFGVDVPVDGADCALIMVLWKISRSHSGNRTHLDHYDDMAGYSAIAGELIEGEAF